MEETKKYVSFGCIETDQGVLALIEPDDYLVDVLSRNTDLEIEYDTFSFYSEQEENHYIIFNSSIVGTDVSLVIAIHDIYWDRLLKDRFFFLGFFDKNEFKEELEKGDLTLDEVPNIGFIISEQSYHYLEGCRDVLRTLFSV
jgi:hypothetical protein